MQNHSENNTHQNSFRHKILFIYTHSVMAHAKIYTARYSQAIMRPNPSESVCSGNPFYCLVYKRRAHSQCGASLAPRRRRQFYFQTTTHYPPSTSTNMLLMVFFGVLVCLFVLQAVQVLTATSPPGH